MKFWSVCMICSVLCLAVAGCQGLAGKQNTTPRAPEYWPTNGWKTSTPERLGMDSGKLADMFAAIESRHLQLHSLLVVRDGYIVVEAYYPPYGPDIRHAIESNTKSVIGTLTGIAIDQGAIRETNQKLVDFFPEQVITNLDPVKRSITLGNLLSMTPGLDCEDRTPGARVARLSRPRSAILKTAIRYAFLPTPSGGKTCGAIRRSHCAFGDASSRDCRNRSPRTSKPSQPD